MPETGPVRDLYLLDTRSLDRFASLVRQANQLIEHGAPVGLLVVRLPQSIAAATAPTEAAREEITPDEMAAARARARRLADRSCRGCGRVPAETGHCGCS